MQAPVPEAAPGTDRPGRRLPELEGFRAIAVLSVMLFHYFQRFGEEYPYGNQLIEPARYGWLGVYLFFVISGFVIALTLYETRSPVEFLVRRVARLMPAMILCATITFLMLRWIDTPFAHAHRTGFSGFLPSLSFTDPWLWQWLLPGADYIDGAYWSLFVEVRFYFWAALAYFLIGRRHFLALFTGASLAVLALYAILPETPVKLVGFLLFFPHYLPLFCSGMLAHALFTGDRRLPVRLAFLLFGALSVQTVHVDGMVPMLVMAAIILLFVPLIHRRAWLAPVTHPAITLVGTSSYALYLVHQYVGVALISLLPRGLSLGAYLAFVLGLIALLAGLAILIFRVVEQPVQRAARQWLARGPARPVPIVPVGQA